MNMQVVIMWMVGTVNTYTNDIPHLIIKSLLLHMLQICFLGEIFNTY